MERAFLTVAIDAAASAEEGVSPSQASQQKWMAPVIVVLSVGIVGWCIVECINRLPPHSRDVARRVGWVVLHLCDYLTNILLMVVLGITGHTGYLAILIPTHLLIGCLCAYSALKSTDWRSWPGVTVINLLFIIVVLGLMQGIQIKLVYDEYQHHKAMDEADDGAQIDTPKQVAARYHLKAFDGFVEGFVFAAVALHALIVFDFPKWDISLYLTAFFCFLSSGLAMMEVDVRTSMSMQQVIQEATFNRIRHHAFRSSEFALRLLTLLAFIFFMSSHQAPFLGGIILLLDYLIGVIMLAHYGGLDPCYMASFILGIPLLAVNVMQFVDAPGMSIPAQSITAVIVPVRLLQIVAVMLFIVFLPGKYTSGGYDNLREEFANHQDWMAFAGIALVVYLGLLICYAMRIKRSADLHSAVAAGDAESLSRLLSNREAVLDVNRYGPDGRTPLHLAAFSGQLECMQLLMEGGASLQARTSNLSHNTTLHLAARSKDAAVIRYLCKLPEGDAAFLNATNSDGDTALHIAAKYQHVDALQELLQDARIDTSLKNGKGQTAAECAPSDKFGFDRNSPEHQIAELLRHAENGEIERTTPKQIEMTQVIAANSSGVGRMTTTRTEGTGVAQDDIIDDMRHEIPLMVMKPTEEKRFLQKQRRQGAGGDAIETGIALANAQNVGLSTFMLGAGLGALSLAFTSKIVEQNEDNTAVDQPEAKAKLDDFTEIKPVGEGAFGKVVMVKHKETGDIFAMKIMDKAKFKAQKITRKAHSEQMILKTTRHPFIVALHFAFQGSTFWALVMDYCPNGDLQKLLIEHGSPGLPYKEVARYCGEVLLAVEHLHSIRVIFRDLKLENVVIDTKWRSRVTDFGLAKKLQTEADAKTMCGSYGYAAPEIMMNAGRYTYAVDLYSFGVMVYMMVSGGEESTKKKQRLPPVRHQNLRRNLQKAEKNANMKWASPEVGALELLNMLTADDAAARKTASDVKKHRFFELHLGKDPKGVNRTVDSLYKEEAWGAFGPPPKPQRREEPRPSRR